MTLALRRRLGSLRDAASRFLTPPAFAPSRAEPASLEGSGSTRREILRQVRLIELRTRGWVDSLFGGEYHSVFKGQGMDFADVRPYQIGDDVRSIDWNVTARTGEPYVKKFVEERELTVLIALDLSGSKQFGTRGRFKAETAAEIAAVLALSAVRNNDRVGLLIFTDGVEHFVAPKKGRRHALRLIRDVLAFRPRGTGTDLAGAMDYAGRVLRHRSIIFLLSDFQPGSGSRSSAGSPPDAESAGADPEPDGSPREGFAAGERVLRAVSRRHDLVAIRIDDAGEERLPEAGLLALTDPETGGEYLVDTGRSGLRDLYATLVREERLALRQLFRRLSIDEIEVRTDDSYVRPLLAFFRRRGRQRAR